MGIDKRIIELTEVSSLSADEFVHVDSSSGGSKKYNLKNIQDQIDALPEVDDTLTQAGDAADAKKVGDEITEIKDDLSNISTEDIAAEKVSITFSETPYYIDLSGTTANINSPIRNPYADFRYAVVPCSEGDVFIVTARGGNAPRAWGFVGSTGTVLDVAPAMAYVQNLKLVAPSGAAYLVINDLSDSESYKVITLDVVLASSGLSNEIKTALLNCFNNVAWKDTDGQMYYNALSDALYETLPVQSITVVHHHVGVYKTGENINNIKDNLTVTATFEDGSTLELSPEDYALSGSLADTEDGRNTITVVYKGKTATFVAVAAPANRWVNDVLTINLNDCVRYSVSSTYPYYKLNNNTRISYVKIPIDFDNKYKYKISAVSSSSKTINIGANGRSAISLDNYADEQTLQNNYDPGWLANGSYINANGDYGGNNCVWLQLSMRYYDDSTINKTDITSWTITRSLR